MALQLQKITHCTAKESFVGIVGHHRIKTSAYQRGTIRRLGELQGTFVPAISMRPFAG
jgi:hypothetical protein